METIAEHFGVSYLQAHRLARRFVKEGWARRSDIDWPIVDKRGKASRISRVAIIYVSPADRSYWKQWK